ncbi:hypothetical protein D3C87_1957980 [compost metagenome]
MQQQMQRQQVAAGLQQELYGLLYRIQQVQYGVGTDYLGGGIGIGIGVGGGGLGAIPAPGYGGGGIGVGTGGAGAIPAPGAGGSTGNGVILAPR